MAFRMPKLPTDLSRWLWPALAVLITVFLLAASVVDISPGEAAVRINNITGSETAVVTPGWTLRVPFVHALYVLDAAPQSFVAQIAAGPQNFAYLLDARKRQLEGGS